MSSVLDFKALASAALGRLNFANWANLTFGGRRNLNQILGYREVLDYWDYRDRYARGGVAKAVVDTYPEATWRGGVEVYEDENPKVSTEFEKGFSDLVDRFGFWQLMQQADILAGLSTFSVILIGVSGDSQLSEPLPKGETLLFLKPYAGGGGPGIRDRASAGRPSMQYGAFASVATYIIDPKDENFGKPKTYYIKNTTPSSSFLNYEVHWSRVIHVAEGCLEDDVFGIPRLECVYDLFDDLMKVEGGGSEAYWLRANQGMHVDVDKDMGLPSAPGQPLSQGLTPDQRTDIKDKFEELQHQLQRVVVTRGIEVKQLGSDVANFAQSGDFILKLIAGAAKIPARILTGSEMGTLASEQDAANFDSRVQDRRTGYAGPKMVRRLLDRLIQYGYIAEPKQYIVGWPVKENMDGAGKAKFAGDLATVNKTQGSVVFPDDEIRKMAFDLDPLTAEQKTAQGAQLPVTQPIRENADATNNPDGTSKQVPVAQPLKTMLKALEAAIEADDLEAIGELLVLGGPGSGVYERTPKTTVTELRATRPGKQTHVFTVKHDGSMGQRVEGSHGRVISYKEHKAGSTSHVEFRQRMERAGYTVHQTVTNALRDAQDGPHSYSTTQVQLPDSFLGFGQSIPDEDLDAQGCETDPHVTLKYGLLTNDAAPVRALLAGKGPITFTLGKLNSFVGEGYDVLYCEVKSDDLRRLNALVSARLDVNDSHYVYTPHATIAYLKPGRAEKYIGRDTFAGQVHVASSVTFASADGERTVVRVSGM